MFRTHEKISDAGTKSNSIPESMSVCITAEMQDGNNVDYTPVYRRVANTAGVPLLDALADGGLNQLFGIFA